jgi:hypothetical protein
MRRNVMGSRPSALPTLAALYRRRARAIRRHGQAERVLSAPRPARDFVSCAAAAARNRGFGYGSEFGRSSSGTACSYNLNPPAITGRGVLRARAVVNR